MFHLHCDVDNIWVYESEFGSRAQFDPNRMYEQALPDLMDLFENYGARATFFVIGRDLSLDSCKRFCLDARRRGHEIGNHTYSHPEHFFELSYLEKEREIVDCEEAISSITEEPVTSFRAPGYYIDRDVLTILIERGYHYDSSILPGVMNQVMGSVISSRSGSKINKKFGRAFYAIAPDSVSRIVSRENSAKSILELPLAACPIVRTPVHSSFVFLSGIQYFRLAARLMSYFQKDSVILFHGIDTLEYPQNLPLTSKVPSLTLSREKRLALLKKMLETMSQTGFVSTSHRLQEGSQNYGESKVLSWALR